ncbi:hypothetical protein AVEN_227783-1, partial [Araneus ventricosus]
MARCLLEDPPKLLGLLLQV